MGNIRAHDFGAVILAFIQKLTTRANSSSPEELYDTTRDAILTCARKPTRVSLIYCTENLPHGA